MESDTDTGFFLKVNVLNRVLYRSVQTMLCVSEDQLADRTEISLLIFLFSLPPTHLQKIFC